MESVKQTWPGRIKMNMGPILILPYHGPWTKKLKFSLAHPVLLVILVIVLTLATRDAPQ